MRKILSISLDQVTEQFLSKIAKSEKCSKSEIVKRALKKYSFSSQFKALRKSLKPYAEKAGYFTDDEIFRDF